MEQRETSFYATDHWKLNRHITADYGLRFEHFGAPFANAPWGDAVFDPSTYSSQVSNGALNPGISWYSIDPSVPISGNTETFLTFSPRVGASIDVFGDSKTVVRGGWGMYRYGVNLQTYGSAASTASGSTGWSAPGTAATWEDIDQFKADGNGSCAANAIGGIDAGNNHCAPSVVFGIPTNLKGGSVSVVDSRNHDQPYTVTYSLNIDQALPNKLMAEVSYVGNYSALGQNGVNLNYVPLGAMTPATVDVTCADLDVGSTPLENARLQDSTCQQRFRPYNKYQAINAPESSQKTQYDSLQAKLTKSAGWATFGLNYAFAKNMGGSAESAALPDYGQKAYWNIQSFNRAQVFNASYVLEMPKLHLESGFLNEAANGWQLSGITQIQSGMMLSAVNGTYFNLQNGANSVFALGTPDATVAPILTCDPRKQLQKDQFLNPNCFALPTPASGTLGNTRMPYLPGPMYWGSDLAAQKSFAIKEHQSLEFRATAKNFLNHDLLSFYSGDSNLTLNFSGGGSGSPPLGTLQNGSTFGQATAHFGQRLLEFSTKYNF
jgi:hypothetical protein